MDRKFDVKVSVMDMFNFMMYHNYSSIGGKLSFIFSVAMLILAAVKFGDFSTTEFMVVLVLGLLFTIINPIMIFVKSVKQVVLNPMFKKPLTYELQKDKIIISQGEVSNEILLTDVTKVVETRRSILVFVTRVRAYIWPKGSLKDQYAPVKEQLKQTVKEEAVKLK